MSINNKRSYTEYTVTQPTTDFAIGFDAFDEGGKDNILVTLNGVLVESLGYAAIRKNESTVSITPAITEGTVRLTRETDIDESFHKFTAGALFSAKSMDENFQQVRHSQQEVRDGFVFLEHNTNGIVQEAKAATGRANEAADVVADLVVGKVRAQDVSTEDGSTQDVKNTEYRNELDALPFVDGLLPATKTTYLSDAIGAVNRTLHDKLKDTISVKDFGAKGDGVADDTIAINKAITAMDGKTIDFPAGTYLYSELDNPAKAYSGWVGAGSGKTILKCTAVGGVALKIDAFPTLAITPFINGFTLRGMSILAPTAQVILEVHGLARSMVGDIRLNGTDGSEGTIGLHWRGSQLSQTDSIYCTYEDGDIPETGVLIEHGKRGGETIGSPSNNVFTNLYPEGSPFGIIMSAGDQNLFIGGSPESCTIRGLTIGTGCRYNTFISTGFENDYATSGDISDNGIYTRYINCYTSKGFEINGKGISIDGGIHEKVYITTAAIATTVKDITVAYWDTGGVVGGFTNDGKATRYQNIYNQKLGKYIHPFEDRYGVTVTASPFEWSNDTGVPVKIRTMGELEQVLVYRGTDFWAEVLPQDIDKTGIYTLQAGERIRIAYTTEPTFNVIPLNGL